VARRCKSTAVGYWGRTGRRKAEGSFTRSTAQQIKSNETDGARGTYWGGGEKCRQNFCGKRQEKSHLEDGLRSEDNIKVHLKEIRWWLMTGTNVVTTVMNFRFFIKCG